MADVLISVAGRAYRLACRDGEEESLRAAARYLDSRAERLQESLGAIAEPRLLLMAGLLIAGESLEGGAEVPVAAAPEPGQPPARLRALVERVEALAGRLEGLVSRQGLEEPAPRS